MPLSNPCRALPSVRPKHFSKLLTAHGTTGDSGGGKQVAGLDGAVDCTGFNFDHAGDGQRRKIFFTQHLAVAQVRGTAGIHTHHTALVRFAAASQLASPDQ